MEVLSNEIPHEELLRLDPQLCLLQARELPSGQGYNQYHNARQRSELKDQNTCIKYEENIIIGYTFGLSPYKRI